MCVEDPFSQIRSHIWLYSIRLKVCNTLDPKACLKIRCQVKAWLRKEKNLRYPLTYNYLKRFNTRVCQAIRMLPSSQTYLCFQI